MNFIVTGGMGFIGSHLTEKLLSENHRVTVVDNLTTGCRKNLPQHSHLRVLEKDILAWELEDFPEGIDGVAHLAGTPSLTKSWDLPLKTHENNLSATIAVIQLCQKLNIPRLVFASSAAVYGDATELPLREQLNPHPTSPYGLQKLASEQYGYLFAQKIGFSFVPLRLFNVFGPRQLPNSEYSGAISIFTKAMRQGLPITIYGDGTQTRDFVYVKDVARAFLTALTTPLPFGVSLTCNIGTGKKTSILDLVNLLKTCFPEWKADMRFVPPRPGEIRHSSADISRTSSVLNFTPEWPIAEALADTKASITN